MSTRRRKIKLAIGERLLNGRIASGPPPYESHRPADVHPMAQQESDYPEIAPHLTTRQESGPQSCSPKRRPPPAQTLGGRPGRRPLLAKAKKRRRAQQNSSRPETDVRNPIRRRRLKPPICPRKPIMQTTAKSLNSRMHLDTAQRRLHPRIVIQILRRDLQREKYRYSPKGRTSPKTRRE